MKVISLSTQELGKLVSELVQKPLGRVSFCEELEVDIIEWTNITTSEVTEVMRFDEIIPLLNEKFNVSITTYDVMELGELGIGFVFNV